MPLILTDAQPRGLGYMQIDQRAGGELPPGTPRNFEADTYTCSHCQYVVVMNPARVRERYKCKSCAHHICDACSVLMATTGQCQSFARRVDDVLERELRHPGSSIALP